MIRKLHSPMDDEISCGKIVRLRSIKGSHYGAAGCLEWDNNEYYEKFNQVFSTFSPPGRNSDPSKDNDKLRGSRIL